MTGASLEPIIKTALARIIALARADCASAGAFHIGAVEISPACLAVWVTAKTDKERDRLKGSAALLASFRQALAEAGYPATAIPHVGFAFESQETVDRDWKGSWWACIK